MQPFPPVYFYCYRELETGLWLADHLAGKKWSISFDRACRFLEVEYSVVDFPVETGEADPFAAFCFEDELLQPVPYFIRIVAEAQRFELRVY